MGALGLKNAGAPGPTRAYAEMVIGYSRLTGDPLPADEETVRPAVLGPTPPCGSITESRVCQIQAQGHQAQVLRSTVRVVENVDRLHMSWPGNGFGLRSQAARVGRRPSVGLRRAGQLASAAAGGPGRVVIGASPERAVAFPAEPAH
jgi:hypothetical protein